MDAAGNLFIADAQNHVIREVNHATGVITTVAGNGVSGYSGDGTAATGAELYYPRSVAVDAAGDLLIADSFNNVIREVNYASGIITTVAGNGAGDGLAATSAALHGPEGVAVDAAGDIFIADTFNNRIREVNHATGVITTVAGDGVRGYSGDGKAATSAELDDPFGLAVDSAGDIFIADTGNNRIREVHHATGLITTVAGNGASRYSGDGIAAINASLNGPLGVAVDVVGDLFIADTYNDRIREVNHATGIITTVAGSGLSGFSGDDNAATSAKLNYPQSVALDAAGDLFIVDSGNRRIREVNHATGVITTVAGNGDPGYSGYSGDGQLATSAELASPTGVAVDAAGDLFIADHESVAHPAGLTVDAAGDPSIAVSGYAGIREVNHATGIITTVAGNGVRGYSGDGKAATSAELNPAGLAVDSAGNLFIADAGNNRIREVYLAQAKGLYILSATSGPGPNALGTIRLTFNQAVVLSSFRTSNLALFGPNGGLVVRTVTPVAGSGNTVFDVSFAAQTAVGTYTLYVGSNAKDAAGDHLAPWHTQFIIPVFPPPNSPGLKVISAINLSGGNTLGTIRLTFNQPIVQYSFWSDAGSAVNIALLGRRRPHRHSLRDAGGRLRQYRFRCRLPHANGSGEVHPLHRTRRHGRLGRVAHSLPDAVCPHRELVHCPSAGQAPLHIRVMWRRRSRTEIIPRSSPSRSTGRWR